LLAVVDTLIMTGVLHYCCHVAWYGAYLLKYCRIFSFMSGQSICRWHLSQILGRSLGLESPVLDVGLEGPDIGLALGGQVLDLGLEVPVLGLEDPVRGSSPWP